MTPPDEVLSVPEDLGLPTDCIAREFHSAQVDQQHRRKLTLTPTSSVFIFHGISQGKQQQDAGEYSPGAFTDSQGPSSQVFSSKIECHRISSLAFQHMGIESANYSQLK